MLTGLRAVIDVQHLYRPEKPHDRGTIFRLLNGLKMAEAEAALVYADAARDYLVERGAQVLTNDPTHGILVGPYSRRNLAAQGFNCYLACHVNAGDGTYSLFSFMSTTLGERLATALGHAVTETQALPLRSFHTVAMDSEHRGAVCIERTPATCATVLCEPFFGDNPVHQTLMNTQGLRTLGAAIGAGVAAWWNTRPPSLVA